MNLYKANVKRGPLTITHNSKQTNRIMMSCHFLMQCPRGDKKDLDYGLKCNEQKYLILVTVDERRQLLSLWFGLPRH